jgi:hypothetical protein
MSIKSPGGSTYPYYYKGGEIHGLKYGSFFSDEQRLFAVMDAEEAFIRQRPARLFRAWVDFYETAISDKVVAKFLEHTQSISDQLVKLAIVGCSAKDEKRIKKAMKEFNTMLTGRCAFFEDPEEAKTWLVTGGASSTN